jgi:hypothetical protein
VKFDTGDFTEFDTGDFMKFGTGDFMKFGTGDFVKFDTGDFMKSCQETPNSFKIGCKHQALYTKLWVRFVVACDINSLWMHFCVTMNISIYLTATCSST